MSDQEKEVSVDELDFGGEEFEKELDDILGINVPEEVKEEAEEVVEEEPEDDGEPEDIVAAEVEPEVEIEPVEPVIEDDEPEDELTTYKNQNAALLARLEKLEGTTLQPAESIKPDETPSEKPQFLTEDDDIDDILADKGKLNDLMVMVYNKAIEASNDRTSKTMQASLPETVTRYVQKHLILRDGINEFFDGNKDLLAVRKTVGAITDEVISEHGDWNLHDVLVEAGKRTREVTGIKVRKQVDRKRNPALAANATARKKASDQRTAEQKEIDDIL